MKFNNIDIFKRYGTKHCYFWVSHIVKPYKFCVKICGEEYYFDYTEDGYEEMQKWAYEKRQEVLKEFGNKE